MAGTRRQLMTVCGTNDWMVRLRGRRGVGVRREERRDNNKDEEEGEEESLRAIINVMQAPEIILGHPYDAKADVFSFGMVLACSSSFSFLPHPTSSLPLPRLFSRSPSPFYFPSFTQYYLLGGVDNEEKGRRRCTSGT